MTKRPSKLRSLMTLIKAVQEGEREEAEAAARIFCGREMAVIRSAVSKVWKPLREGRAFKPELKESQAEERAQKLRIEVQVNNLNDDD